MSSSDWQARSVKNARKVAREIIFWVLVWEDAVSAAALAGLEATRQELPSRPHLSPSFPLAGCRSAAKLGESNRCLAAKAAVVRSRTIPICPEM